MICWREADTKKWRKANISLSANHVEKNRIFDRGYNLTSTKKEYYNIEGEINVINNETGV